MLRSVLGVVLGYLVMFIAVFVTFSIAYLAMGVDRAFRPGSYDVSAAWAVTSLVLGFVAAAVGGLVCAVIAGRSTPPKVLAGVVLALGLLMAIPLLVAEQPERPARTGDVSNLEAMQHARQPVWFALVNPAVGAAGVLLGAALPGKRR